MDNTLGRMIWWPAWSKIGRILALHTVMGRGRDRDWGWGTGMVLGRGIGLPVPVLQNEQVVD